MDNNMEMMMAEAKRFMEDYYKTFDANWADLVNVIQGKEAIVAKLTSLQQCQHQIGHIDCTPLRESGGVFVTVTGNMWLDGKPDAYLFNRAPLSLG